MARALRLRFEPEDLLASGAIADDASSTSITVRLDAAGRTVDVKCAPSERIESLVRRVVRDPTAAFRIASEAGVAFRDATLEDVARQTETVVVRVAARLRQDDDKVQPVLDAHETAAETRPSRDAPNSKQRKTRVAVSDEARGQPLSEAERRQIMHMLDLSESRKAAARARGSKVFESGAMTYHQIAELTGKHPNTIAKMKRERDRQQCARVADVNGFVRTVEVPQPGQRGGRRWTRMNEEQMRMCTRIAVENPRLTAAQIRERMQTEFPNLTMCDSTVLRALNSAKLQFLRAKMRDPRSDGTPAHAAEKRAFLEEQKKGSAGELGANDLFFMDETTVYLNLTSKRAWGTAEHPAEIRHAKGKTVTIGIYAGLGLVSDVKEAWSDDAPEPKVMRPTDPRGNHCVLERDGAWHRTPSPPRFMLFWWLRPPTRDKTVLSRFLEMDDVLDPSFTLHWYSSDSATRTMREISPIEKTDRLVVASNVALWREYFAQEIDGLSSDELADLLWRNGIEYRQVDEGGDLVTITGANKRPHKVWVAPAQMREYLVALQALVARALLTVYDQKDADLLNLLRANNAVVETRVPRYYFTANGRNNLGGTRDSERGDQSLFLRYLQHHVQYVEQNFPPGVRSNLRDAWDSAAQHGKTDVTSNTKSFVHDWVESELKIRGAIFLPVREPDFNPVELLFAFVKSVIRRRFPGFTGEVSEAEMIRLIDEAFGEVTEEMVKGWLRYGCYVIPGDPAGLLEANPRCEYKRVVDVQHYWGRIVADWEARNAPLDAHARARILTADPSEVDPFLARFPTVGAALASGDGSDPIKSVAVDQSDATANVNRPIPATARVTLASMRGQTTVFDDNFKSEAHRELRQLTELRREPTGFRLIHRYLVVSPGLAAVKAVADGLLAHFDESEGPLATLRRAHDRAIDMAALLPMARAVDPLDLLLDVQERIFHPKLDTTRTRLTVTADGNNLRVRRLEIPPHRSVPVEYVVPRDANDPTRLNDLPCRIESVDSKSARLTHKVTIRNRRLYQALGLDKTASDRIAELAEQIRKELASTPYAPCVVMDDVNWQYAAAVVALKAYRFERERMDQIGKDVVREFIEHCGDYERLPDPAQDAIKRAFETGVRRWRRVKPDGTANMAAGEQAPFFVVTDLRAERRTALQLKLLARREDERRWPGYPDSERHERNGVPIRTVEPNDRVSLSPARPIRYIQIVDIHRAKADNKEYVEATLTFEDGDAEDLLPRAAVDEDEKRSLEPGFDDKLVNRAAGIKLFEPVEAPTDPERLWKVKNKTCLNLNAMDYPMKMTQLFGEFSEYNQNKLDLAKQRFKESRAKRTKDAIRARSSPTDKRPFVKYMNRFAVVGTYKTHSIHYAPFPASEVADSAQLLFDPVKSLFYPPPHVSRDGAVQPNGVYAIGLADSDILNRSRLAPRWTKLEHDVNGFPVLPFEFDEIVNGMGHISNMANAEAKCQGTYHLAYKCDDTHLWVVAWEPLSNGLSLKDIKVATGEEFAANYAPTTGPPAGTPVPQVTMTKSGSTAKPSGAVPTTFQEDYNGVVQDRDGAFWKPVWVTKTTMRVEPEDIKAYPLAQFLPGCRIYTVPQASALYRLRLPADVDGLGSEHTLSVDNGASLKVFVKGKALHLDRRNVLIAKAGLKALYRERTLLEMDCKCTAPDELARETSPDFELDTDNKRVRLL